MVLYGSLQYTGPNLLELRRTVPYLKYYMYVAVRM